MRIKVIIGFFILGLFSCENDPNAVLPENENEPYVYSDSLLDEYQRRYDYRNDVVVENQIIADSLFIALINKIDSLMSTSETEVQLLFFQNIGFQSNFVRSLATHLNNYFVSQVSEMIKMSEDSNFGLDSVNGQRFENHFKVNYRNGQEYYELLDLAHLNNRGDYNVPYWLFVSHNGIDGIIETPNGTYLLDSVYQYRDKALMALFDMYDHVDYNKLFETRMDLYSDDNEKIYKEAVKTCLSDLDERDIEFISEFCRILVVPELEEKNEQIMPWIAARFDRPILGAADTFLFFRLKVILSEIHIYKYLLLKLEEAE